MLQQEAMEGLSSAGQALIFVGLHLHIGRGLRLLLLGADMSALRAVVMSHLVGMAVISVSWLYDHLQGAALDSCPTAAGMTQTE